MRGVYQGLQSFVREEAKSAIYIWCWAHRLNLAVKEAVTCCEAAAELFGNIRCLYNLINGSKNHVAMYSEIFKQVFPGKQVLSLKRVDTTRWMSHGDALETVLRAFEAIVETLDHIKKSRGDAVSEASGLLTYLLSEKFLITALTFSKALNIVGPLNKALQGIDIDLMGAAGHVEAVLGKLSEMRSDEAFQDLLVEKERFIEKSGETFSELPKQRKRRVPRRPGEKADDSPIDDPLHKLKVSMYFASLDSIRSLIAERFSESSKGIYKDLSLLTKKRIIEIRDKVSDLPEDAFSKFCEFYGDFVELEVLRKQYLDYVNCFTSYEEAADKLPKKIHVHPDDDCDWETVDGSDDDESGVTFDRDETGSDFDEDGDGDLQSVASGHAHQHSSSIIDVLNVMNRTGLKSVFPTLYTALRIAVTLPVSSASTERSLSKLRLVKTRLRTSMLQLRLEALLIASCENDIEIDVEEVIDILVSLSTYLSNLLC